MSRYWRGLLGWTLILFAIKAAFIVCIADVNFYGEELEKGSVAKAMVDRIPVDFHRLSYHYYEGGGFFISGLKALGFLAVGENILTHRLVGLLTCLLAFFGLWRLCFHHFGPVCAHLAAAVFVFGPTGFQRYSLLSLGIHFEALALGLPLLDEGLRLIRNRTWIPSSRRALAVGVLAGFGVFFSYQNLLILGWVGLWVLALRWRWLFSKGGVFLATGTLLGLSPMLYMAFHVGTDLFDVHGTGLAQVQSNAHKALAWAYDVFAKAPIPVVLTRLAYPALLAVALLLAIGRLRGKFLPFAFLSGYLILWMAAWYLGPFLSNSHIHWFAWLRWAPMTVVSMILGAYCLSLAWQAGGTRKRLAQAVASIAVVLGMVQTGQILAASQWRTPADNWQRLTHWKGYNYRGHFRTLLPHLPDQSPETLRALLAFDEPHRNLLLADIATVLTQQNPAERTPLEWLDWLERIDPEGSQGFAQGLGPALVIPHDRSLEKALQVLETYPAKWRAPFAWAIGYYGSGWSFLPEHIQREIETVRSVSNVDPNLIQACLTGIGARFFRVCVIYPYGRNLVMNPDAARQHLQKTSNGPPDPILTGFEAESRKWLLP